MPLAKKLHQLQRMIRLNPAHSTINRILPKRRCILIAQPVDKNLTNEILIDGLPSTNPSDNTDTYTPSPESIEELKITTTPFSAEFGHTGGGVLLANTRHGAKQIPRQCLHHFDNRLLNAENYFQTVPNLRYDQNDPGFTASGPLSLPGHSGRDKTFFFTDLNITFIQTHFIFLRARVPTDREKSGDFSQDTGITIYDPGITIYDPATTKATTDSHGNQVITRQPLPGIIIPTNRIDAVAAQLVKYFPKPNGDNGGGVNYQIIPISRSCKAWSASTTPSTIKTQSSLATAATPPMKTPSSTSLTSPTTTTPMAGMTTNSSPTKPTYSALPHPTTSVSALSVRSTPTSASSTERKRQEWASST